MDQISKNLVARVRSYPVLYDRSHNMYNDVVKKEKTWKLIASEMNIECKLMGGPNIRRHTTGIYLVRCYSSDLRQAEMEIPAGQLLALFEAKKQRQGAHVPGMEARGEMETDAISTKLCATERRVSAGSFYIRFTDGTNGDHRSAAGTEHEFRCNGAPVSQLCQVCAQYTLPSKAGKGEAANHGDYHQCNDRN